MRVLLPLLLLLLTGCHDKCPTPGETRCQDQVAQLCLADGTWADAQDCAEVTQQSGTEFVCCYQPGDDAGTPSGHVCLPPGQCAP